MKKYIFFTIAFCLVSPLICQTATHVWNGSIDTDWNNANNWTDPTTSAPATSAPSAMSIVEIPDISPSLQYPILMGMVLAGKVTIKNGATLDLGEYVVKNTHNKTSEMELFGKLRAKGTSEQAQWLTVVGAPNEGKISLKADCTIEYYGNLTDAVFAGPYQNLSIKRAITTDALVVNGNFLLESNVTASSIIVEKKINIVGTSAIPIVISATSQEYKGDANFTLASSFLASTEAKFKNILAEASGIKKDITFECAKLTIAEDLKARNITVSGATSEWTSGARIIADGNITAQTVDWKIKSGTLEVKGNIDAPKFVQEAGKVVLSGTGVQSLKAKTLKTLEVKASSNATLESISPQVQKIESFINEGTMNLNTGSIFNIEDASNSGAFTIAGASATIKKVANSGNITVASGVALNIEQLENTGNTAHFTSNTNNFILTKSLKNTASVFSASNLKLAHQGDSIVIEGGNVAGNTSLGDVECENAGGKTIEFRDKITIGVGSKLSGLSRTNLLTLKGGGVIHLSGSPTHKAKYVAVKTDLPANGALYVTEESKPIGSQTSIEAGNPSGWVFESCLLPLKWKSGGGTATLWSLNENWIPRSVPTRENEVTIPAGVSDYPILTQNEYAKEIIIEGGASLDLSTFIVETSGGNSKIKNAGTLKMEGNASQKSWLEETQDEHKVESSSDSLIYYYGSSTDSVWAGEYQKLTIERSIVADSLVVNGEFIVEGSGTMLSVTAPSQQYKKEATIKRETSFLASTEAKFKKVSAGSANDIHFQCKKLLIADELKARDIDSNQNNCIVSTSKIEVNSISFVGNDVKWTASGDIKVQTNVTLSGTTSKWDSSGNISVDGNIVAQTTEWKSTAGTLEVKGNIDAPKFVQEAGKVVLSGTGAQSLKAKTLKTLEVKTSSNATLESISPSQLLIDKAENAGSLNIAINSLVSINKLNNSNVFSVATGTSFSIGQIENTGNITIASGAGGTFTKIINSNTFTVANGDGITIGELDNVVNTANFTSSAGSLSLSSSIKNSAGIFSVDTLKLIPSGTSIVIEGSDVATNTTINRFLLEHASSKDLTIKKKITVVSVLKLSGLSESALLTVKGDGTLRFANTIADRGLYLAVHTNIPIENGEYATDKSKPVGSEAEIDSGKPLNWIFDDSIAPMRWTGNTSDSWMDRTNWIPKGLPAKNTEVVVPNVANHRYPVLISSDVAEARLVHVQSGAMIDLALFSINTASGTARIENAGILKMEGNLAQKAWFENGNTDNAISIMSGSMVEYYGSSTDSIFAGAYQNLKVKRTISTGNLIVQGEFVLEAGGSALSVSATSITVENTFKITGTSASSIVVDATNQKYKDNANISLPSIFRGSGEASFKKILASGIDLVFECGSVKIESDISAHKLQLHGTHSSSSFVCEADIILSDEFESAVEQLTTKGKVQTSQIKINRANSTWQSYGDINVLQNIQATNVLWTAFSGTIEVKGNLLADKLVQNEGKIFLNGTALQNLQAKKIKLLEVDNTSSTDKVKLQFEEVASFILKRGYAVLQRNVLLTKEFANENGIFDAVENEAVLELKPVDTLRIRGKAKITNDSATTADTGTKFYKLHCKTSGGKILEFAGAIEVLYDIGGESGFVPPTQENFSQDSESLILQGNSGASKLSIVGDGQIWFNESPPFPKPKKGGKFLHVASNVQIRGGCYRVMESTHDEILPRNWIFEEYAKILASLAITNTNNVCVIFNTPVNKPPENSLKITSPSSRFADMTSIGVSAYGGDSEDDKNEKWLYQFSETFTPELLLESDAILTMGNSSLDFIFESASSDLYPYKRGYISDIGLNLIESVVAKNTKSINIFDGSKQLPFINTSILAGTPVDSAPLTLYVSSISSAKYWIPDAVKKTFTQNMVIGSDVFVLRIYPDASKSVAEQKTFVLATSIPQFKNSDGVEFMFCYDNLPCARLTDEGDMFSFSLWKFNYLKTVLQRAGVSIFNNVINPEKNQEATIEITTKKGGILTVQVMTIDGSRVKTIVDEYKSAGNYSYKWGGFNEGGGMVARGIYFVRILGNGIDEVRKVLVIR